MTAIHETVYPRIRSTLSDKELEEIYTPTSDDLVFIHRVTKSTVAAFGGMVLLKTWQRVGYFPPLDTLPPRLLHGSGMRHYAARPPCLHRVAGLRADDPHDTASARRDDTVHAGTSGQCRVGHSTTCAVTPDTWTGSRKWTK